MKRVQFDECLDDRKLVRACQSEGLVEARRFPRDLRNRGIGDEQVLRRLLPACDLFITNDGGLAAQNAQWLATQHPGVLVLSLGPESVRTFTTHAAGRILRDFKTDYAQWADVAWANSILEITPDYVRVQHIEDSGVVDDIWIERKAAGWQDELTAALEQNAGRTQPKAE